MLTQRVQASTSKGQLSLTVSRNLNEVAADWSAFETRAKGTLFQTLLWCQAWSETAGVEVGAKPVILIGRDSRGAIQFILPLQIRRRFGIRTLEWLGAPHSSYGFGLYLPAFLPMARQWFDDNWQQIVTLAGPVDAIALCEMPVRLQGIDNPMAGLFNLTGANRSYVLNLSPDFEKLHAAKRPSEDRRAARKKEQNLQAMGGLEFALPNGRAEMHDILDVMFEQQKSRLAEQGVHGVFGPAERWFFHRIAERQDEDNPVLAPYFIKSGGNVLAVLMGGLHGGTFWALISSLAPGDLRKYSPGDLALRRTIADCCARGLDRLDFSAGDSRYKLNWSDEVVQLHAIVGARTLRGLPFAALFAIRQRVKSVIKGSPMLMSVAITVRRLLFGRKPAMPTSG